MREIRENLNEEVGEKVLRELHIQLKTLNAKKLGLGAKDSYGTIGTYDHLL